MSNISEKITDFLVRKKAIKTSDYAIYKYGADILVENVSVTLLLMCFGLFINKCVETIVFILTFVGLRRVSGGYHAPTKTMCHILTFGNWAVLMLLIMIQERYGFAKCWMAMVLCAASLEIVYLYLGYAKYYIEEDRYIFRYRPANLFNTDAFGTVCKEKDEKVYVDKEGKFHTKGLQITLYIWPFSHKMGVEFYEIHDGVEESEQIYIDKDINCVTKNLTNEQQKRIMALIDNNKDEIKALLEKAEDKWGL